MKLYKYMQGRTRYVSIQLGIGGWQPFDAAYVHERGYGDCKALSNYMVALLKEAGVPAYPVLVHGGELDGMYRADFPSQQFNHVIVCVPLEKDSLWLECTSHTMPAGHLGEMTEDRFALLLNSRGGELVRTPATRCTDNQQRRVARVQLTPAGTLAGNVVTAFSGDRQDRIRMALADKCQDEREKWLGNDIRLTNAELHSFALDGLDSSAHDVRVSLDILVPTYGSVSGSRIFFHPNLMERKTSIPRDTRKRSSPVRFPYPYRDVDSIVYLLPDGFAVEALPPPLSLRGSFGSFHASTKRLGDTALVYVRALEIYATAIPAPVYSDYRNFCLEIVKNDRSQAVLAKRPQ
jgi:hypothetical protein